jgi:delta(3,5)-delta(2,4)-dienoyl-CoA isomerase
MSLQNYSSFKHFVITSPAQDVAHVQINRPEKFNAFFEEMWIEFGQIFDKLSLDSDFRAIILSGAGDKAFTAGLDVQAASQTFAAKEGDIARIAFGIRHLASSFQKCVASVERCEKRRSS